MYCIEFNHEECVHATIEYDENFHLDDQVKSIKFMKNNSIPLPETAYAIWRILGDTIENRKSDQKNTFYVRWGFQKYNVVEVNTLKDLGLELLRLKSDVEK